MVGSRIAAVLILGFLAGVLGAEQAMGGQTVHTNGGQVSVAGDSSASLADVWVGVAMKRVAYSYPHVVGDSADQIARTGTGLVRLTEEKTATLVLEEFEMFLPGEKKVVWTDEAGRVLREEPIELRFFRGHVEGAPKDNAFLAVAPHGLYGAVTTEGVEYSIQPRGRTIDGATLHEVTWYAIIDGDVPPPPPPSQWTPGTPLVGDPNAPRGGHHDADVRLLHAGSNHALRIRPYAEPSFRSAASDFAYRISTAFGYGQSMWQSETSITLSLYSVVAPPVNFAGSNTCGGGTYDNGMWNFEAYLYNNNLMTWGPSLYTLFHGLSGQASNMGCANAGCPGGTGCLSNYNTGYNERRAVNAVQAVDHFWNDIYNPNDLVHLGKAANHEASHNAGEPDHPGSGWHVCNANLMDFGQSVNCAQFWRTTQTKDRIMSYAWPRLGHL